MYRREVSDSPADNLNLDSVFRLNEDTMRLIYPSRYRFESKGKDTPAAIWNMSLSTALFNFLRSSEVEAAAARVTLPEIASRMFLASKDEIKIFQQQLKVIFDEYLFNLETEKFKSPEEKKPSAHDSISLNTFAMLVMAHELHILQLLPEENARFTRFKELPGFNAILTDCKKTVESIKQNSAENLKAALQEHKENPLVLRPFIEEALENLQVEDYEKEKKEVKVDNSFLVELRGLHNQIPDTQAFIQKAREFFNNQKPDFKTGGLTEQGKNSFNELRKAAKDDQERYALLFLHIKFTNPIFSSSRISDDDRRELMECAATHPEICATWCKELNLGNIGGPLQAIFKELFYNEITNYGIERQGTKQPWMQALLMQLSNPQNFAELKKGYEKAKNVTNIAEYLGDEFAKHLNEKINQAQSPKEVKEKAKVKKPDVLTSIFENIHNPSIFQQNKSQYILKHVIPKFLNHYIDLVTQIKNETEAEIKASRNQPPIFRRQLPVKQARRDRLTNMLERANSLKNKLPELKDINAFLGHSRNLNEVDPSYFTKSLVDVIFQEDFVLPEYSSAKSEVFKAIDGYPSRNEMDFQFEQEKYKWSSRLEILQERIESQNNQGTICANNLYILKHPNEFNLKGRSYVDAIKNFVVSAFMIRDQLMDDGKIIMGESLLDLLRPGQPSYELALKELNIHPTELLNKGLQLLLSVKNPSSQPEEAQGLDAPEVEVVWAKGNIPVLLYGDKEHAKLMTENDIRQLMVQKLMDTSDLIRYLDWKNLSNFIDDNKNKLSPEISSKLDKFKKEFEQTPELLRNDKLDDMKKVAQDKSGKDKKEYEPNIHDIRQCLIEATKSSLEQALPKNNPNEAQAIQDLISKLNNLQKNLVVVNANKNLAVSSKSSPFFKMKENKGVEANSKFGLVDSDQKKPGETGRPRR